MAFTGKATYSAGTTIPELAEDVSDLIGIVSPYEASLLDALGDPMREAMSTHHEWLEDSLLPNKDAINDATYSDPARTTEAAAKMIDFGCDSGYPDSHVLPAAVWTDGFNMYCSCRVSRFIGISPPPYSGGCRDA